MMNVIPNPRDVGNGIKGAGEGIDSGSKGLVRLFAGIPRRSHINAELKASKDIMDAIVSIRTEGKKHGLPDEIVDGLCRDTIDRIGRLENYEKVLSFAQQKIEPEAQPEDLIGSEWINAFRDHSEKVTDADVQALWGAILAGEINQPGSVSKRAMSILADMDKGDLEALERLCSRCIGGRDRAGNEHVIWPMLIGIGESFAMDSSDIDRLKSVGVIDFTIDTAAMENKLVDCSKGTLIQVGSSTFALTGKPGNNLPIPKRPFTRHGYELARLCSLGNAENFVSTLIDKWASMGFEVGIVEAWLGDQARFRVIRSTAL